MRLSSVAAVVCTGFLLTFQMLAQVQGTWSTTNLLSPPSPSSPFGLEQNIQVLLTTGNVLVAGGISNGTISKAAQLYAPSKGWTLTGSMEKARYNFAAVVLQSGKVLVEGGLGSDSAILESAELYDPTSRSWSSAGHMSYPRYGHTATLLQNGQVLVTGGCITFPSCTEFAGVSELYDPATNVWTTTKSLNLARAFHTATLLRNGKVLVVGGCIKPKPIATNCLLSPSTTNSSEIYNPNPNPIDVTWTNVAPTSVARYQHAAALLASGEVLVSGGYCGQHCAYSSAEIYHPDPSDPKFNTWTPTPKPMTLAGGRFAHTATTLNNNTVLIAAGKTISYLSASPTATTEIYDVVTGTFQASGLLHQKRNNQTASRLKSGQAMVVGGDYFGNPLSTAEIYTPLTLSICQGLKTACPQSPLSLSFGPEQIGLTSTAQTVTVTNVSHGSVTLTVTTSGDFALSHTCPATLASNKSCTISVTFKPTTTGTRIGAVTLHDSSLGNPTQTIALTGTGQKYAIAFTPPSLTLPSVAPRSFSPPASATVTNDGSAPLTISKITITPADGTFKQTNDCPLTLDVGHTCTIQVVFHPPGSGTTYSETLQILDAKGNPYNLTGLSLIGTSTD